MTFLPKLAAALLLVLPVLTGCEPGSLGTRDEENESHFIQAKGRQRDGDIPGALQLFEQALEVNPGNASAHLELGLLYEKSQNDFISAAYHFQKFLQLRPNSEREVTVKDHILTSKQELAKTVLPASLPQTAERELMALTRRNEELRHEVDFLRTQYTNALAALSNQPARAIPAPPTAPRGPIPRGETVTTSRSGSEPSRPVGVSPTPAARSHTVAQGETLAAIARRYGVSLESLRAANPGLNEWRLQVGQALRVPAR